MSHSILHVNRDRGLGLVHQILRVPMSLTPTRVNGRFGEAAPQHSFRGRKAAGEGFPMRVAAERCSLARLRPALENLPRWKPRGAWNRLWESTRTVVAAAASGVRLIARQAPDTVSNPADNPDEAVRCGDTTALCSFGSKRKRAVRTGPTVCSRRWSVMDDVRFVMRPAPTVGHAALVSVLA